MNIIVFIDNVDLSVMNHKYWCIERERESTNVFKFDHVLLGLLATDASVHSVGLV